VAKVITNLLSDERGNALEGFEEAYQMSRKVKYKRFHYSTPTYFKFYCLDEVDGNIDTDTWGKMEEIYRRLSFFFPIYSTKGGLFATEGELISEDEERIIYDFGMVRSWKNYYYKEKFSYRGETFEGQEFVDVGAEIKGTEDLGIEERLWLHSCLLDRLEDGERIEDMNWELESVVNLFLQGVRLRDLLVIAVKSPINKGL
jgi:hypothetical protein